MLKIILQNLIKLSLSVFKLQSTKEKQVFFLSYQGEQYSCNPRAVYEYINKHFSGYTLVWAINEATRVENVSNKNKLICVHPKSLAYYKYLISSKFVITNIQLNTYIPKKKKSVWINTWHGGGAFKKVEYPDTNAYMRYAKKIQIKNTDFYVSSSQTFTEIMSASTGISQDKFLKIGMPRNDLFFEKEDVKEKIRSKILRFYNLEKDSFIVVFAPTYRGKVNSTKFEMELDVEKIKTAYKNRFNKNVVLLVRAHHAVKGEMTKMENVLDGTLYPDMQDLLIAADSLITDYSSCIYDFALTNKPGFLFVPDLSEYESNRGFYTPVSDWPYKYAKTNDSLAKIIMEYDQKRADSKIKEYHSKLGSFDQGNATEKLLQKIGLCNE